MNTNDLATLTDIARAATYVNQQRDNIATANFQDLPRYATELARYAQDLADLANKAGADQVHARHPEAFENALKGVAPTN